MLKSLLAVVLGITSFHATAQVAEEEGKNNDMRPSTISQVSSKDMTVCKKGTARRTVTIKYDQAGTKIPCRVLYVRDTENPGVVQELYTAQFEEGFCESKAKDFTEKLNEGGWSCVALKDKGKAKEESGSGDAEKTE